MMACFLPRAGSALGGHDRRCKQLKAAEDAV